jgi:hypothetical protein
MEEAIVVEIPEAGDPNPANGGSQVKPSEIQVEVDDRNDFKQIRKQLEELKAERDAARRDAEASRRQAQESWQAQARANADRASARTSELESRLSATKIGYSAAKEAAEAKANEAARLSEAGDWRGASNAQREASTFESKATELEREYQQLEQRKEQDKAQAAQQRQQQAPPQSADPIENFIRQSNASPALADWVRRHPEFVRDPVVYNTAIAAHHKALRNNLPVESKEYFDFIEREALGREESEPKPKRMPPAAPVSRDTNAASGRGPSGPKFVKLTQRQLEAAKELGMTKERYAEWVDKIQSPDWDGPKFM